MHSDIKDFRFNSSNTDLIYNRQQFIQLVNEQIQLLETSVDSQILNEQYKFVSGFLRESSECNYQDLFSRNEQLKNHSSFQRALDKSAFQSDSNYNILQKQLADESSQNNNKHFDYFNSITPQQYQQKYQFYNNSSFFNDKNEDIFPINLNDSFKKIKNYSDLFDNQNNKQSTNFSEYFDTKNRYRILKQQNLELDFIKVKQPNTTDEVKENYFSQLGNQSQSKHIKIVKKSTSNNNNLPIFSSPQQEIAQEEKAMSKNFSFEDMLIYEEKNTDKNSSQKFLRHEVPVQEFQLLNIPDFSPKQNSSGTSFNTTKEKQLNQKSICSNQTKQIQKFNNINGKLNYDFDIHEGNILRECQKLNIQVSNTQNQQSYNIESSKQNKFQSSQQKNVQSVSQNSQFNPSKSQSNNSQKIDLQQSQQKSVQNNLQAQNKQQINSQSNIFPQPNSQFNIQNNSLANTSNNGQINKQYQQRFFNSQEGKIQNICQTSHSSAKCTSNEKSNFNTAQEKMSQKPTRKKKERAKKILKAYYQQNSNESLSSNPINKKKKICKTNNKVAAVKKGKSFENNQIKATLSKGDSKYDDSNLEESLFENITSEETSNSDLYYDQESENNDSESLKQESDKSYFEDQSNSESDIDTSEKGFIDTDQANNSSKLNLTTKSKRGHYKKYSVKLKKKLVNLLLEGEQPKDLSQRYNIPMKNLQRWKIYGAERREGGGRKIMDLNMEVILLEYCIDYTLRGRCRCPRKLIMQKARDFTKEDNKFKGSKGWLDKYSTRTGLSKIMSEFKQLKIINEREIFKYVKSKSIEHIKQKIKQVNPLNIFTSHQYIKFLEGQLSVYKNFWEIELTSYKNISSQYWEHCENKNSTQPIQNNIFSDIITEYRKYNRCPKLNELNYFFGVPSEYLLKCLGLQNSSDKSKQSNDQTLKSQRLKEQSQTNQVASFDNLKFDQKQGNKELVEMNTQNPTTQNDHNQNFVGKYYQQGYIQIQYLTMKDKQVQSNSLIEGQSYSTKNEETFFLKKDNQSNLQIQQKYKQAKLISDDDSSIEEIFRNYENNID